MRIAIVTDAWEPQVNGVVNALRNVSGQLRAAGHEVMIVAPDGFVTVPCPTYPEIRLAFARPGALGDRITAFGAEAVHLLTEGPLSLSARRWCVKNEVPFTTAFCTNFPDYLEKRTGVSARLFWHYFRWFHAPSQAVMASTPSLREQLAREGLGPVASWGRGVDLDCFTPDAPPPDVFRDLPRPIMLYVGRIAVEKNIDAFLRAEHPGTKVLVGDGPARERLEREYPDTLFLGKLSGRALAGAYAGADVFVFPSRTDTFGVVMIEALACGTPVAAYPVNGPIDVVHPGVGALDEDLSVAIADALECDRDACAAYGATFSWTESARQLLAGLKPFARETVAV